MVSPRMHPPSQGGTFTPEQTELRRVVRRLCAERFSSEQVRERMADGGRPDRRALAEMGGLGWLGLAASAKDGGQGAGHVEQCLVVEEIGRTLGPGQATTSVGGAALAIARTGTAEQRMRLLPHLCAGTASGVLAITDDGGGWDGTTPTTAAEPGSAGWRVSGKKRFVLDGPAADQLVVAATLPGGRLGLTVIAATDPGVGWERLDALDLTRTLGNVALDSAQAELLGSEDDDATQALTEVVDLALVTLAHQLLGGTQACLDAAVAHATSRRQFARPIGSFQAVKHRCADMLTALETARSAAYAAAHEADRGGEELPTLAAIAKVASAEAYAAVAEGCIQVHGALGYTWEHDAHLHLRRARTGQLQWGDSAFHRERLLQLLDVPRPSEKEVA